jgi:hypothetical protein
VIKSQTCAAHTGGECAVMLEGPRKSAWPHLHGSRNEAAPHRRQPKKDTLLIRFGGVEVAAAGHVAVVAVIIPAIIVVAARWILSG